MFPTFMFHKEQAPDGRRFDSQAALTAAGDGWVDTPAKFDPNYEAPPQLQPGNGTVALRGGVPVVLPVFPSFMFNREGLERRVNTPDEAAALAAEGWRDTPDPAAFDVPLLFQQAAPPLPPVATPAPVAAPAAVPPPAEPVPPVASASTPDQEAKDKAAADKMNADAQQLHNTAVADVTKQLDGATREQLEYVKQLEALNQEPRITLIRFINAALAALPPATA